MTARSTALIDIHSSKLLPSPVTASKAPGSTVRVPSWRALTKGDAGLETEGEKRKRIWKGRNKPLFLQIVFVRRAQEQMSLC